MSAKDERVHDLVTEQAADWLVANRAELSAREREAFGRWLTVSPLHVREYLGVSAVARDMREACADLAADIDAVVALARAADEQPTPLRFPYLEAPPVKRRWRAAPLGWSAAAALCLAAIAWWTLRMPSPLQSTAQAVETYHFITRHGEQQTYKLPDHSVLHLNTDTSVTVRMSGAERLAVLECGEADFEVAHAANRRFRVLAGSAQMLDLGTRFDVRLEPDVTVVTVAEGRVAVGPLSGAVGATAAPDPRLGFVELTANQAIRVAQATPGTPAPADAQAATSWMRRQISFEHEPLSRVAHEINRYATKPIVITTPALGKLEISGVFATDDTTEFVAFLRSMKGVHVEVTESLILVTQD
jgi:transmembrane sensor